MVVNSTANLIAGKQILLEMIKNGRLKLRTYERRPVRISMFGDLVVSTGNEVSQLITDTAEFKLFVSYMNVWTKRDGNWKLLARPRRIDPSRETRICTVTKSCKVSIVLRLCRCPSGALPPVS